MTSPTSFAGSSPENPLAHRYTERDMLFATTNQSVACFLVSLAFWLVARELCERGLTSLLFNRYKLLSGRDRDIFNNTFLSFVHSAGTTFGAFVALWSFPALLDDLLHADCSWGRFVVIWSTGYFFYDLIDFVRFKLFRDSPSIYAHHAVVLTVLYFVVTEARFTTYVLVTLVCEANSVHLHARTMIRLLGLEHRRRYFVLNWLFLLPTLLATRVALGGWIIARLYADGPRFDDLGERGFWVVGMIGQAVINVLNWGLLITLVAGDSRIIKVHLYHMFTEDHKLIRTEISSGNSRKGTEKKE